MEDFSGAPFGGSALSKHWQQILVREGVKPGLEPEPSPSPARAVDQGPAPSFREPEPCKAEPKPGLLSPARPCKPLEVVSIVQAPG